MQVIPRAGVGVDIVCIEEETPEKARATAVSVQFAAEDSLETRIGYMLLTLEVTGVVVNTFSAGKRGEARHTGWSGAKQVCTEAQRPGLSHACVGAR